MSTMVNLGEQPYPVYRVLLRTKQNDRRLEIRAAEVKIRKKEKYARSDDLMVPYYPSRQMNSSQCLKRNSCACVVLRVRCVACVGRAEEAAAAVLAAAPVGHPR
jgi:hypothetical protein